MHDDGRKLTDEEFDAEAQAAAVALYRHVSECLTVIRAGWMERLGLELGVDTELSRLTRAAQSKLWEDLAPDEVKSEGAE